MGPSGGRMGDGRPFFAPLRRETGVEGRKCGNGEMEGHFEDGCIRIENPFQLPKVDSVTLSNRPLVRGKSGDGEKADRKKRRFRKGAPWELPPMEPIPTPTDRFPPFVPNV